MQQYQQTVNKLKLSRGTLGKEAPRDRVLEEHEARIKYIVSLMPVIVAVANKHLKDKHWKKIFERLGEHSFDPKRHISLTELLSYKIIEKVEAIEEISARASGEK